MSVQYSCKRFPSRPLTLFIEPVLPEAIETLEVHEPSQVPETPEALHPQTWIVDPTSHQPTVTTIQFVPETCQPAVVTKPEPVFKSILCQFDTMMLEEQNVFVAPAVSRSEQLQEQTERFGLLSFRQVASLIVSAVLVLGWILLKQT
jgi:hypothetical protein